MATTAEARQGTANGVYQTPELTWQTLDNHALVPLNIHVTNYKNPHKTTPEKIDSPRKPVVVSTLAGKYLDTEIVANTNAFMNGNTAYTYSAYFNYVRSNLLAGSFTSALSTTGAGYLSPYRMGRGIPNVNSVLRAGPNPTWQSIDSLIIEAKPKVSSGLLYKTYPVGTLPVNAFNAAIQDPWAYTASEGSIICYRLQDAYQWGAGNGAVVTYPTVLYIAYKSANGWIQV